MHYSKTQKYSHEYIAHVMLTRRNSHVQEEKVESLFVSIHNILMQRSVSDGRTVSHELFYYLPNLLATF